MPMNVKLSVSVAVLAGALLLPLSAAADEAADLLAKMRTAIHTLSYNGTLVYAQGNELSTYQISHTLEGGAEKESVLRLAQGGNGSATDTVESFSLAKLQQVQPQMEKAYVLDVGGDEFVANTKCKIVIARPRDKMRYLQRYCIEPESGMLLKYSLVDRSHEAVEQLMFTALTLSPSAPAANAPTPTPIATADKAALPVASAAAVVASEAKAIPSNAFGWKFTNLPAGFQQVNNLEQAGANGQKPVQQIILSDGMTSVSVFIASPDSPGTVENAALSAGAMNIFSTEADGYKVTLVGEVPVATLESISKSLHREH